MSKRKEREWDEFIESRILTGMIVSTDFLSRVHAIWNDQYIQSPEVVIAAHWVFEYWEQYGEAPDATVKDIYVRKMRAGAVDEERGELIEIMFERASEDYGRDKQFNSDYLFDQARDYFRQQHNKAHTQEVNELLEAGETDEAARKSASFTDVTEPLDDGLFLDSDEAADAVKRAFSERHQGVVKYPPPFGTMINPHLGRDAFVAFLAHEKSGKSHLLMDVALRALRQKSNVAFFQAGDMSEEQQLKRICACLARTSPRDWYPEDGKILTPVKDCIYNQADQCDRPERESDFGPFDDWEPDKLRAVGDGVSIGTIKEAMKRDSDYKPCRNCKAYRSGKYPWGSVWFQQTAMPPPLEEANPWDVLKRYMRRHKSRFRLSTHASGTLSSALIRAKLNDWERRYGFLCDVVCIAEGSLVLTDRGLIPIENISCSDRLWDGESWINHGGLIFKGEKKVITYAGITATPGHLVYSEQGWRTLESCRRLGLRIAQTGAGRTAIRFSENRLASDARSAQEAYKGQAWKNEKVLCVLCTRALYSVWRRQVDAIRKFKAWISEGLSGVYAAQTIPGRPLSAASGGTGSLPKSESKPLAPLWRAWNRIPVCFRFGGVSVGYGQRGVAGEGAAVRPYRQRWSLRTWKYPFFYGTPELFTYKQKAGGSDDPSVSPGIPIRSLFRQYIARIFKNNDAARGSCSVGGSSSGAYEDKRKVRVWDIRNAGPFHRFTVQGLLVHNCIDYADLLDAGDTDQREFRHRQNAVWSSLRGLAQERHCLVLTATQADAKSYGDTSRLSMGNFSEDKRKNAHVTAMYGLNQSAREKQLGLMYVNEIVVREGDFNPGNGVYILQSLGTGRPFLGSFR